VSTTITLYNHYHNGDLFVCKQFVQNLIDQCSGINFRYCHFNHPKTLADLNIEQSGDLSRYVEQSKIMLFPDEIAINTWVGAYQYVNDPPVLCRGEINLYMLHNIWSYIYRQVSELTGQTLRINSDIKSYVPQIDYSKFDVSSVNTFVECHTSKKVLISNGEAMSGQSFSGDLAPVIEYFADAYKHITFICTKSFETSKKNIAFTDRIIQVEESFPNSNMYWNQNLKKSDINEISYLSTFCDLIIGKNSGPFIYCLTKENVFNTNKTFIALNINLADNLLHNIQTKSQYIQHEKFDVQSIMQLIDSHLCRL
jgi:hypothetical protein